MSKLPPHRQRRLNMIIAEVYGGQYADWYQLARELQLAGATYAEIAKRFTALGVSVSLFAVRNWMKDRDRTDQDHKATAA